MSAVRRHLRVKLFGSCEVVEKEVGADVVVSDGEWVAYDRALRVVANVPHSPDHTILGTAVGEVYEETS